MEDRVRLRRVALPRHADGGMTAPSGSLAARRTGSRPPARGRTRSERARARDDAEAALDAARTEAERLLAAARGRRDRRGTPPPRCGHRRRRGGGGGDPCGRRRGGGGCFVDAWPPARRARRRAHRHLLPREASRVLVPMTKVRILGRRRRGRARRRASSTGSASWRSRTRARSEARRRAGRRADPLDAPRTAPPARRAGRRVAGRRPGRRRSRRPARPPAAPLDAGAARRAGSPGARRSRPWTGAWTRCATRPCCCPGTSSRSGGCCRWCPSSPTSTTSELRLLRLDTAALVLNTDDEAVPRGAARRARRGARGPLRAGLDAHRGRGDRLPGRLSRTTTTRRCAGCSVACRFGTPRCPRRSSASRCARPSRRWSTAWRSFREPSRPSRASARRCCARMSTACSGCAAAIADELERLDAVERLGATRRAFVAECWVPRGELARLRRELAPGSAPPSSSRTWRRLRATRRRRC